MLELLGNVKEEYIEEANPQKRKQYKFKADVIAAACLCFLIVGGLGFLYFMKILAVENYYAADIEEISSVYEGELLAENISYEEAVDSQILLCYTGRDLPFNSEGWKTLSVSAKYEDYNMILNCGFNGETFLKNEEDAIDTIQYRDLTVSIYQAEKVSEYDLAYYAVFEYQDVCYELRTYSNDKKCIYEILQAVLGISEEEAEDSLIGEHNFTDVLGYQDYYVKVEQTSPGFIIQKYYMKADGVEKCIAEVYGYAVPGPEVYGIDMDGDGIKELICNCMAGTGAERVVIYRNNDGVIERGHLSYDLWDSSLFPGITNRGSSYIQENYIVETNTFKIGYPTETGYEKIILENMDMFEFEEFVEEL